MQMFTCERITRIKINPYHERAAQQKHQIKKEKPEPSKVRTPMKYRKRRRTTRPRSKKHEFEQKVFS